MMKLLREHAESIAVAIELGLADANEAVDWACVLVAEQANPSEELLALAGAIKPHPLDVVGLLRALPGSPDPTPVFRKLLGRCLDLLQARPDAWSQVTLALEHLANAGQVPAPLDGPCHGFDGERGLAQQGIYGSVERAYSALIAFLEEQSEPANTAGVLARATRYCDNHQPGWVECVLPSVDGALHYFVEKVPVVTTDELDETTQFPQPVVLACEILSRDDGQITIDTARPCDIQSTLGSYRFTVSRERILANLANLSRPTSQ